MAIGDKAAAAGLAVYASTQDRKLGYQNDNQRGDDIADVMQDVTALQKRMRLDGGFVNEQTSNSGRIRVGHGLGVVPKGITVTTAANGQYPEAQHEVIAERNSDSFIVVCYRSDVKDIPLIQNRGAAFYWTAVA
ncbi:MULTISPECIES: hypothetical protein [unclassified Frondihabitans]|uniref:hypothetical protein n=1 Tax=unclassified Frondihabitans TaxID=2626248 RepID=UPI000F4FB585|nr:MULTISPECIES: hypothetical protein [unclassified Frondihabitans]RPE75194.1 hypothetical protein EDF37_2798 [Frondihabitans sp. PhB153]RPF04436.1 hypothetical protein EDF39_2866 [Frondihabitans sp. PhB161]